MRAFVFFVILISPVTKRGPMYSYAYFVFAGLYSSRRWAHALSPCSPPPSSLSCSPGSARCRRCRHRRTSLSFLVPRLRRLPPAPPVCSTLPVVVAAVAGRRCRLRISPSKPPFIELRHPASRPAPLPILSSASTPAPVRSDAFFSFLLLR